SDHVKQTVFAPHLDQPFTPTAESILKLTGNSAGASASVEVFLENGGATASVGTIVADSQGSFSLSVAGLGMGENRLTAVATDAVGNVSRVSDAVVVIVNDTPSIPAGLAGSTDAYDVNLTWNPNPETDIAGYKVYQDGVDLTPSQSIANLWAFSDANDYNNPMSNPDNITDFDLSTYWSSEGGSGVFTPQSLYLNFDQAQVDSLDIVWGAVVAEHGATNLYAGRDFEIRAWTGYNWVTLQRVTGNTSDTNHFTFSPAYPTSQIAIFLIDTTDQSASKQ